MWNRAGEFLERITVKFCVRFGAELNLEFLFFSSTDLGKRDDIQWSFY